MTVSDFGFHTILVGSHSLIQFRIHFIFGVPFDSFLFVVPFNSFLFGVQFNRDFYLGSHLIVSYSGSYICSFSWVNYCFGDTIHHFMGPYLLGVPSIVLITFYFWSPNLQFSICGLILF